MPKYGLPYELVTTQKDGTTLKDVVDFELSPNGVWFCKQNPPITLKLLTGTQRYRQIKQTSTTTRVKGDSPGTYKFSTKDRAAHLQTSASERQDNRGKKLILRTGRFSGGKFTASSTWEPKSFTMRCPAWLNNRSVLDALYSFFRARIKFTETPTKAVELFPVVLINGVGYTIPNENLNPTGDMTTPDNPGESTGIEQAKLAAAEAGNG